MGRAATLKNRFTNNQFYLLGATIVIGAHPELSAAHIITSVHQLTGAVSLYVDCLASHQSPVCGCLAALVEALARNLMQVPDVTESPSHVF